ncbi:PadR family transcriptional regulator [Kitasatospora sp. NPDC056076]|uniref:PadR family transcriptional regulator n=1 Tax=Kitasatospora sp. NPDC056076 TaxID=3345703 RepID=UPI0035DEDF44
MTPHVLSVLETFVGLGSRRFGEELVRVTNLPSGTIVPILSRLERAGWLAASWETPEEREAEGAGWRPLRKYFELTNEGLAKATVALLERKACQKSRSSVKTSKQRILRSR